ncbi:MULTISPECIES: DUF6783 domain-containing protein [Bacillota]
MQIAGMIFQTRSRSQSSQERGNK